MTTEHAPNAAYERQSILARVGAVAGLAGIPAIFLPFTFSISPARAIGDHELWELAAPFFLALPISALTFRWLVAGRISRAERRAAYAAGVVGACITLSLYLSAVTSSESGPSTMHEWIAFFIPLVVLLLGVWWVAAHRRSPGLADLRAVGVMQLAYVANGVFCLVLFLPTDQPDSVFSSTWQSGAYLTVVTVVAYVLQLTGALSAGGLRPGAPGPAGAAS